ncbi:MAG: hypothetical protein ACE5EU_05615 [Paracoccaceae bacterium]
MNDRNIDLDRNLFLIAFSIARRNWMPCAVAALLLLASNAIIGFVDAPLALAVLRALILMIVGYSAYRYLLSDGGVSGWRAIATAEGRLPWRYAGMMLIILSPILLLGIVWNAPGTGVGPSSLGEIVLGVVLVVIYAALYILVGTALPAIVERGEVSLVEAFERGRRNYRAIGRALVFGVWLFRAGSLLFMIVLSYLGVATDFFSPSTGAFNAAASGPMLLFMCSYVYAECLTAIVLVRAYRRFPVMPSGAVPT